MRTALQIIVSSLSFSLLYYKIMHMRHGAPAGDGEEAHHVAETP